MKYCKIDNYKGDKIPDKLFMPWVQSDRGTEFFAERVQKKLMSYIDYRGTLGIFAKWGRVKSKLRNTIVSMP